MVIRPVRPEEYERLGEIIVQAYVTLPGHVAEPDYEAELAEVAARSQHSLVLAAVEDDGELLGGVTYVGPNASALTEHTVDGAASIRMLAVAGGARRRGVGEALTRACIDQAVADGCRAVVLHSTPWMTAAHRLYRRLGFVRDESLDLLPVPDVPLLGFRLEL